MGAVYPAPPLDVDVYLLLDRLLAGPAFYEAVASAYRAALGAQTFEGIMGKEGLEGAIRTTLAAHGMRVVHGPYESVDGLECDAVVETPHAVVLIEAKKKGLTRKTLAGDALKGLFDVSGSLLASHAQLARHEYSLRRDGELRFSSGEVVRLEGRRIDRVAITLLDLGSLQDKMMVGNLVTHLRGATLQIGRDLDKAEAKAAREFNENAQALLDAFEANAAFVEDYDRLERFSVRSFSLGQLIALLEDVSDAAGFEENLAVDRHMSTGTGDWLLEFRQMKKLRADHPDMYSPTNATAKADKPAQR